MPELVELPGVGQNFHNHVLTGVIYECKQPVPPGNLNLSESALFLKSDPGWVGPDLQIAFVHVPFNIIVGQGHPNSVSILPGVVRPMSRGWIKLASADPMVKPLVNPNYLGAQSDRDRLVQAVKLSRDIFAHDGVLRAGSATNCCPALTSKPMPTWTSSCATAPTPTTTSPARARWARMRWRSSIRSCASTGSRGCASPMRAFSRPCRRATATRAS